MGRIFRGVLKVFRVRVIPYFVGSERCPKRVSRRGEEPSDDIRRPDSAGWTVR